MAQTRAVEVSQIFKSFGTTQAVIDVSFAVERGEILGLLGPNGAGKTTTIRVVLDIFKPDRGMVSVLGGPMTEEKKDRIGYMPEERGLYQDLPLERCLVYLGTLKGLTTAEARQRVGTYLKRFDLAAHKDKKVKELSKGMQQKGQLINTILHQPELIIVDEPFAALDPLNTQMVKDLMIELRQQGASIIMSTHQMHHAEELCDRIVLIDQGRIVLQGELDQVRHQYAGNAVLVRVVGDLPLVPGIASAIPYNHATKWTLAEGTTPQDVLRALVASSATVEQFEIALPTLEEVFIRAVGREGESIPPSAERGSDSISPSVRRGGK
jgi:ABC-2 type transport system ATP-binding protein